MESAASGSNLGLLKSLQKCLLPQRSQATAASPEAARKPRVLLAFSGGIDSLALGQALHETAANFGLDWALAHIHHGSTTSVEQAYYRDQAAASARSQAAKWDVEFFLHTNTQEPAESESALRDVRYSALEGLRHQAKASKIMTAHHHDDLLETRVMRLLRGTGPQGLSGMEVNSAFLLRPWLEHTRAEIEAFASSRNLSAVDDPSNKNSTHLRNWIRNEWLTQLDQKQPGARQALARSLEHLVVVADAKNQSSTFGGGEAENPWDRRQFRDLSALDRRAIVAHKLRDLKAKNFTQTHIEEIVKRLDTVQKRLDFVVAGVEFRLNAQQIYSAKLPAH